MFTNALQMNSAAAVDSTPHPSGRYIPSQMVMKPIVVPRILLVDDDPMFGKIMTRVATCFRAELTYVKSMTELADYPLDAFDVAIVDYDLGSVTGVELTRYIDHHCPMPIVLISRSERRPNRQWSDSITDFLLKAAGPFAILDAAFEANEVERIHREMRQTRPRLIRTNH